MVEAAGRVVAADRGALRAVPAFDNSAMDGVGVRAVDVASASRAQPTRLRVVGVSLPGGSPVDIGRAVGAGEAVRIMTGASLPDGVDAIVMRELTDESGIADGFVHVLAAAPIGQHVRRRGEDMVQGDMILRVGDVVTPGRMNAALCAGLVHLAVHRRPLVAILASGDELKEIGEDLDDGDVVPNSNAHAIAALVRACGCDVRLLGIAGDSLALHVDKMAAALPADALVTIGGVSMGTHDFVRPALEQLGGSLQMWRVAMRPGKPIAFGLIARAQRTALPVFALPGNPVSAHVAAELFLRPALEKLRGARALVRPLWRALLVDTPFAKKQGLEHWVRGEAVLADGELQVRLLDKQGSHHVAALARANVLVRFGNDVEHVAAGALVEVLLLEEPSMLHNG